MANVPAYFPLPAASRRIAMVSGGFLVVLGVMVLGGWYLGIPRLMQLHPTFVAMQFNTAVGFTLAGVTLLTGARGWMGVSRTSAFFVSLLGVLTLAAYLGGWNFGFETWLWKLGSTRPGWRSTRSRNYRLPAGSPQTQPWHSRCSV